MTRPVRVGTSATALAIAALIGAQAQTVPEVDLAPVVAYPRSFVLVKATCGKRSIT